MVQPHAQLGIRSATEAGGQNWKCQYLNLLTKTLEPVLPPTVFWSICVSPPSRQIPTSNLTEFWWFAEKFTTCTV